MRLLRLHRRVRTALTAAALAAAMSLSSLSVLSAPPATAAGSGPGTSPLLLWAPTSVEATSYRGRVYSDLGLRVIANGGPFEIWSKRPTYDDQIQSEWRSTTGPVALPEGTMTSFSGLSDFMTLRILRAGDNSFVLKKHFDSCLNGESVRVRPDADARSPYPWGCPGNPYTVGSVMGIQEGWATSIFQDWSAPIRLKPGAYKATAFVNQPYRALFGLSRADSRINYTLTVIKDGRRATRPQPPNRPSPQPAAERPAGTSAGVVAGPVPDLQVLPAFGIALNGKGNALRFGATTWNAGDSPLVVDGFRSGTDDVMDAYQYFFDSDGNQTGYQLVGQLHFHHGNHNHWHFEDFSRYELLNEDLTLAVTSTKQSWCLANTDAVDYTVPGANWKPENTDLSTACGGADALSIREVLASGSGDTYFQYRTGQAFKLAGVPNGIYYISVTANPEATLIESDVANNNSLRKIRLLGSGSSRRVKVFPVGIIDETWGDVYGRPRA
jgi:Lysyl oxidase